ncbi:ThiF family adenylyltransferase [Puniceicoccus vermicola]|nr:ThiF family adenylyltransferase [Puniceicoccus vermicola]
MHARLKQHLLPGDGYESAAVLLCKRVESCPEGERYLARELILVPQDQCRERRPEYISWSGEYLETAIDQAEQESLSILLVHSHPGGFLSFSDTDDDSDCSVIPCLHQAIEVPHGSAIMVGNGAMRARFYQPSMEKQEVSLVSVIGDDIAYWWGDKLHSNSSLERPVAFTSQMTVELSRLSVAVVGVSGIGSVVAEQLARLGFGEIVLIDFDRVEFKNLNRILNSTVNDAEQERLKVDMFAESIVSHRGCGVVEAVSESILTREAVLRVSKCDVLFSCVDSLEARQVCDLIASRFLMPLFDAGVTIPTRKTQSSYAIGDVCGRIDYVKPGGATLSDREVYTPESLRTEYLRNADPVAHEQELNDGYIKGVHEEAPAVISLNMRAATASVNEFLARAYPFRHDSNDNYARTRFSLAACEEEYEAEGSFIKSENVELALGDREPLLGFPCLGRKRTR